MKIYIVSVEYRYRAKEFKAFMYVDHCIDWLKDRYESKNLKSLVSMKDWILYGHGGYETCSVLELDVHEEYGDAILKTSNSAPMRKAKLDAFLAKNCSEYARLFGEN